MQQASHADSPAATHLATQIVCSGDGRLSKRAERLCLWPASMVATEINGSEFFTHPAQEEHCANACLAHFGQRHGYYTNVKHWKHLCSSREASRLQSVEGRENLPEANYLYKKEHFANVHQPSVLHNLFQETFA